MEPEQHPSAATTDPLDLLLRPPRRAPWWIRSTGSTTAVRTRWILGAVAVGIVVLAVVISRRTGPSPDISRPRAQRSTITATSYAPTAGGAASSPAWTSVAELVVHVAGAVVRPGLVHLHAGARVDDALTAAGGPTPLADLDRVNLAQSLADGVRVFIPRQGEPDQAMSGAAGGGAASDSSAPIDLNTATVGELDALPGVGPSTAAAIIEFRQTHGRFRSVDDLDEVRGIGPAKLESIRPHVRVSM